MLIITSLHRVGQSYPPRHPRASSALYLISTRVLLSHYKAIPPLILCIDLHGDNITTEGTIQLCQDLAVDPEDVVLLSVAYELKSPGMAEWTKQGWIDGWKSLGYVLFAYALSVCSTRYSVAIAYLP